MGVFQDTGSAQFENVNGMRMYPFMDSSSLVDRDGKELQKDVIVDMHLVVPSSFANPAEGIVETGIPAVMMTSVHLSQSMVSACFVSDAGGERNALSVTVARSRFSPYMPYRLEKLAGSSDIGGIVTFGDMEFPGFPETYMFTGRWDGDHGVGIHPCCVAAARPAGLRRIIDPRSGESVSGDVSIRFPEYVVASSDGNSVRLSLEDGAPEALASECSMITGSDACGATSISSINGVRPDEDGNIVLWFH